MQVNITAKGVLRFFGWAGALLFWLVVCAIVIALLTGSGDSGGGLVIFVTMLFIGQYSYLALIPIGMMMWKLYGAGKNNQPFLLSLIRWGTLAALLYIVLMVVAVVLSVP